MGELAVNIKICDRVYPMKVEAQEEARVRAAGKLINERAKTYSSQFGIYDPQDLLAMVAFDCLVDLLRGQEAAGVDSMPLEQIQRLIQQIDASV